MRIGIMLGCLLLASACAFTQTAETDSLLKRLQTTTAYDEKMELLGQLSDAYSYTDSSKAIGYALMMRDIAAEKKDKRGEGFAYYRLGGAYLEAHKLDDAEKSYIKAEELLEKDTTRQGMNILARTWANHGLIYRQAGDLPTMLGYLLKKSIPINEKLRDSVNLGKNYHNIGLIFQDMKEHAKAATYFKKSVELLKHFEYVAEQKDNMIRIVESMLFLDAGDDLKDSAFGLLQEAKKLIDRYPDVMSEVFYLQGMGMCHEYFYMALDTADGYYGQAAALAEDIRLGSLISALNLRRFYIKEKLEDYPAALKLVEKNYFDYASYLVPRDRLLHIKHMMRMQEKLGNIKKSLELHKRYIALYDSIQSDEIAVKVQELEQKYAAKEKETQIIKLNQVAQQQRMQIEKNRQSVYLLIAIIVFLSGGFIAWQNNNRKKGQIARQQAELLEQRIEKMKQEQQIGHFAAVLEGQEQERKRLAIDLHDGLGGSLSGIRLKLSRIIQDESTLNGTTNNGSLKSIATELDHSINDLRHIARNMMPESLLKYGLVEAIKDFCRSMETERTHITFQTYDMEEEKMSQSVQIMVFRIFQELITNAVKHADAGNILAQCLQQGNTISLTVEDDGTGFETGSRTEGIGLANLKNRVSFLGGKLDIHSEKGIGTTTNIEFDIKDETDNRDHYS